MISKTTFGRCLVLLLCALTMGGVVAQEDSELKLTGCEIIHPTGLIVAITDTKIAMDNVPLGAKIRLIFNQEVFRNTDRTVLVMKVDSTGVPQEDPVRVPVEVNGNTVILDLKAARLGSMEYFAPDKSYLESGSGYRVFIPWDFVQTADKGGLDHNYGFLLNTRTQNKVDTINTFWDGSNYKTEVTFCGDILSAREMSELSIWDAFTFLCPRPSGLKPFIPVMEDGPEDPDKWAWTDWSKDLEDAGTKEERCQWIVKVVDNSWRNRTANEGLNDYVVDSEIPERIITEAQKGFREILEKYSYFIPEETGEFDFGRFQDAYGSEISDPKALSEMAKAYEKALRTVNYWDYLTKEYPNEPGEADEFLRSIIADGYVARAVEDVGIDLEAWVDLEGWWKNSRTASFEAVVAGTAKFEGDVKEDIILEQGKMLDRALEVARDDFKRFLTEDGKFNWDAYKNAHPLDDEKTLGEMAKAYKNALLEVRKYEIAKSEGKAEAFVMQSAMNALSRRCNEEGKPPPEGCGGAASFVEELPPIFEKWAYPITKIVCNLMGLSVLPGMLLCPGDARVPPVQCTLEKLDAKGDWVAAGVVPKIAMDQNKLTFDWGKLQPGTTYRLAIPKNQVADTGGKLLEEEISVEFKILSDGNVQTVSHKESNVLDAACFQWDEIAGYVLPGAKLPVAKLSDPECGYYAYYTNSPGDDLPTPTTPTEVYSSPISVPASTRELDVSTIDPAVAEKITTFVDALAGSRAISEQINSAISGLFARAGVANNVGTGATGKLTATQLPSSWLTTIAQFPTPGVTANPTNLQLPQTTCNSGPWLEKITIKKFDGTILSKRSFTAFHGEDVAIDFDACAFNPNKVKQVKLTAICQLTVPTAGQTLTFGCGSSVLYEWKAATTNDQKGTVQGSCSWKTTAGTAASDYVLEFTAVDSNGKTAIVTCSATRLADNGKPHVTVQNWGDGCYFPSNVPLPIMVEGNDPPGGSGIAVLGIDVWKKGLTLFPESNHANWKLKKHDAATAHEFSWDCSKAPGDYSLTVSATDGAGQTTSKVMTIHRPEDKSYPSVSITSPADKAELLDVATISIGIEAKDDVLVHDVELWCRQVSPILGDPVLLQEWERTFPANRSGDQDIKWYTYNWTCTDCYPFTAEGQYQLTAVVWDASGKKNTSKTVTVTRTHDYDAPVVTVSVSPSTVNEKENTNVIVTATIKERSLQAVSLFIEKFGEYVGTRKLQMINSNYVYTWVLNTMNWVGGRYIVEVHATDTENKEGTASGTIIVSSPVKQQPETSTNDAYTKAYINYLTWKSNNNQSTSSSGNGTSNGGGGDGGGSTASDDGSPGGYYVLYTDGGATGGTTSGGDTQQSDSPADDTHPDNWSIYIATSGPNGGSGKHIVRTPGSRVESTWVYTGNPNLFAGDGTSTDSNNTAIATNPFGPAVIDTPNFDGFFCSNCNMETPWWLTFRKKEGEDTNAVDQPSGPLTIAVKPAPLVYSHSAPVFYTTTPGAINSSSGVSIQSAEKIGTAPGGTVGRVVSEQPLATYSLIRNVLIEEAAEFKKLTVNKNNSITTHQNSVSSKSVSLKNGNTTVGGYTYSTSDGVVTKAELTVSSGKTLTLPAGVYYLTKLTLYDKATLNTSGGTIFLTSAGYLHKYSKLTTALRCLPGGNSKIEVCGSASLSGTILAPDWNVVVREGALLTGGIICGKFSVSNNSDVPGTPLWKINY